MLSVNRYSLGRSIENKKHLAMNSVDKPDFIVLPDYPKGKEIHFGYYALFICVAGDIELFINHALVKVEPDCLYAVSPENIIAPKSKSPDCVLRIFLFTKDFLLKNTFKSNALDDFKFFANSNYSKISLHPDEVSSLMQLYDLLNVKKNKNASEYHVEIIRRLSFSFLYEAQAIYSKYITRDTPVNKREKELNLKFNHLVKSHAATQHSLKFYADSLFITPKYLISAIKNASGKTPGVLIDEAIIDEAKQYLVQTNLPVAGIADRLQFTDIATFSKFFKRYTDLSPSAFRKNSNCKTPAFLTNHCAF